ncbi:MAG: heavy-metal-associated domain-containing protein [Clostridia bacterium]|nr:heavy-metal-associated domain-containing protein [Clostridia bacterium]
MFGSKTEKTTVAIEGMMCEHCKKRVEGALDAHKGVKKYEVSLENKCAEVEYAEGKTTPAEIAAAVTAAGYTASVK